MKTSTDIFVTKNLDLAVFLQYALPHRSLDSAMKEDGRFVFAFSNKPECREFADVFFGSEPVMVGDLKAYNNANKAIRRTMRNADSNGGIWERDR
jgi:hypothetical protein